MSNSKCCIRVIRGWSIYRTYHEQRRDLCGNSSSSNDFCSLSVEFGAVSHCTDCSPISNAPDCSTTSRHLWSENSSDVSTFLPPRCCCMCLLALCFDSQCGGPYSYSSSSCRGRREFRRGVYCVSGRLERAGALIHNQLSLSFSASCLLAAC